MSNNDATAMAMALTSYRMPCYDRQRYGRVRQRMMSSLVVTIHWRDRQVIVQINSDVWRYIEIYSKIYRDIWRYMD